METNEALARLKGKQQIIVSNLNAMQLDSEALAVAISQLKGTLVTQLNSVTEEQKKILVPELEVAKASIEDLKQQVTDRTTERDALQAQIDKPIEQPKPVETTPVEEKPVDEQPTPVEEAPVEEKPVIEPQTEVTPEQPKEEEQPVWTTPQDPNAMILKTESMQPEDLSMQPVMPHKGIVM